MPSDHRLASQKPSRLQDIVGEIFIGMSNTAPTLRVIIDDYLERSGLDFQPSHRVDNLAMAMSLIASTSGVALLPIYAKNFLPLSVTSRPLEGEAPTIDLVIGYNKTNTSPILELFLSRLDEMATTAAAPAPSRLAGLTARFCFSPAPHARRPGALQEKPPDRALERIRQRRERSRPAFRRIDMAMEENKHAARGFAHPHVVDVAHAPLLGGRGGERGFDAVREVRLRQLPARLRLGRLDVGLDLDVVADLRGDRVFKLGREPMSVAERHRAIDLEIESDGLAPLRCPGW